MSNIQNLQQHEAIDKIRELAEKIGVCLFCTQSVELPFETRPMGTQQVDDEGNLWFFSSAGSHKNREIKQDDQVQLLYAKPDSAQFMAVYGTAVIVRDRQKIDELWNRLAEAYFPEGKDDPSLTLVCVKPQYAYYWDTQYGKMVSLLSIAAAAITGKRSDTGIEGDLKV